MPKFKVEIYIKADKEHYVEVEADNDEEALMMAQDMVCDEAESDGWEIDYTNINYYQEIEEPAVYNEHFDAAVGDYTKE